MPGPDKEAETVKEEELDQRTRAQVKRDLHKQKTEERKREADEIRHQYAQIKDSPALADILAKARTFAAYHLKLAKDGVGAKQEGVDESGRPKMVDYYLTSEQRIAELDKASGQEQLIAYIEDKLK